MKFTKYHSFAASHWGIGAAPIFLFASMFVLDPGPSLWVILTCLAITLPFAAFFVFGLRCHFYRLRRMSQIRSKSKTIGGRGLIVHHVTAAELDEIEELWDLEAS